MKFIPRFSRPIPSATLTPTHLFLRRTLFCLAGAGLLTAFHQIWVVAFLATILATLWSFPIALFSRLMPRGLATLLTLACFLSAVMALTPRALGPFIEQARQAEAKIPPALQHVASWLKREHSAGLGTPLKSGATLADGMQQKTERLADSLLDNLPGALLQATSLGATLAVLLVLSFFFAFEPRSYRKFIRAFVPPVYETAFDELWLRLGAGLRRWLGGILTSMVIMGCFTALGLKLAGIDNWLLLGLLTFCGTFVPYVGSLVSAVPGLLIALSQSNEKFLMAACIYFSVHLLEGYVVDPFVMRKAVTIQPAVLLLWQLTMGIALGIFGIVIATPLYVSLKIAVDYLYVERGLGKAAFPQHQAGESRSGNAEPAA